MWSIDIWQCRTIWGRNGATWSSVASYSAKTAVPPNLHAVGDIQVQTSSYQEPPWTSVLIQRALHKILMLFSAFKKELSFGIWEIDSDHCTVKLAMHVQHVQWPIMPVVFLISSLVYPVTTQSLLLTNSVINEACFIIKGEICLQNSFNANLLYVADQWLLLDCSRPGLLLIDML